MAVLIVVYSALVAILIVVLVVVLVAALVVALVFSGPFLIDESAVPERPFVERPEPATPVDAGDTISLQEKFVKFETLTPLTGPISAAELGDWLRSENEIDPIVVTADDPKAAAIDWQRVLSEANVAHAMRFESPDQIRVSLPITRISIEILRDRNIEVPAGEWCVLLIEGKGNNNP